MNLLVLYAISRQFFKICGILLVTAETVFKKRVLDEFIVCQFSGAVKPMKALVLIKTPARSCQCPEFGEGCELLSTTLANKNCERTEVFVGLNRTELTCDQADCCDDYKDQNPPRPLIRLTSLLHHLTVSKKCPCQIS